MPLPEGPRLPPAPGSDPLWMWVLAEPALVVEASAACSSMDEVFRADSTGEHSSAVVCERGTDRVGLVSRRRFEHTMSGRFGFGRALFGQSPVSRVSDWDAKVLAHSVTLSEAVDAVLSRGPGNRYDDLILRGPGDEWRRLAAGAVLEALSARLAWRANSDDLTGLANRPAFFDGIETLSAEQVGHGSVAVIFIDLDRMKAVNDTLGHNVGDALLVSVARRLRATARPGDIVARLGGDEFAVAIAIPALRGKQATAALTVVADAYLQALRVPDPHLDPRAWSTASLGAAASDADLTTAAGPETLLREADVAMYRAKYAGGDRVVITTDVGNGLDALPASVADLALRTALIEGELEVYYQPIIDVATRQIISLEALIRWNHPTLGLLGADRVLAAAHAEKALVELDLWILRSALRQWQAWNATLGERAPTWINVNLSDASVGDPRLTRNVLSLLTELGCPPGRLRLELPETASLALTVSASSELTALIEAGVLLTLDDMGAGASSLRHLSTVTITEMKIDRSFVERMLSDIRDHAVVQMLTSLASSLGISVTAEGVETPEQLQALQAMGVDYVQGYLLARPAPAGPTEHLLRTSPITAPTT